MTTKEDVLAFFAQCNDCVIATVGESDQPEAATVGFSETPNLELTIGTSKKSRKYQNIMYNPHVAVVIGFGGNVTVQYEGTARRLTGDELVERQKQHFQKIPGVEHYKDDPEQIYFSITPTWVRYTDFSRADPIGELRQFA